MSNKALLDVGFLERSLNSGDVNGAWKECLDTYEGLGSTEKKLCLQVVTALRDQLIDILHDVSNADERQVCLSLFYVRIKSEWMLLNTQYTYQMDANQVQHQVICMAGLLSALLGALEPYCLPDDIAKIEKLLAQLPNGNESDGNESGMQVAQTHELRRHLEALEKALAQRETALTRLQEDWAILEAGVGKKTAREIVETMRILKDELILLQRSGNQGPHEKYQEFERAFGGLSAHQVSQHVERLETKVKLLEEEAVLWSEGQQQLLKELGDTDPARLIVRFQELQDNITRLTLEVARSQRPLNSPMRSEPVEDLSAMLGSLESALREMTVNH